MKSKILVFIQFFIVLLMLLDLSDKTSYPFIGFFFILVGLSVGVSALYKNKIGTFNIRPDIQEDAKLITDGIYSYIRHPMYTSVLISMFGVLCLNFSILELFLYILLLVNMLVKMFYEESLWNKNTNEYKEYSEKTFRLIPFLF
ncbi:MAG: hypothetical protein COB17_08230 [Sulfurimonas sp.]|nr:MAG: hypothetical protein COB17_08230 [Sulfurimonas sp.]